jgi:hypothetical protein
VGAGAAAVDLLQMALAYTKGGDQFELRRGDWLTGEPVDPRESPALVCQLASAAEAAAVVGKLRAAAAMWCGPNPVNQKL